jgi:hypothetical protein
MLFSLPFLIDRLCGRNSRFFDRGLAAAGVGAAIVGILVCAARQPAVSFLISALIVWGLTRFHPVIGGGAVAMAVIALFLASTNERMQRITTLEDTSFVSHRMEGSMNDSFFTVLMDYPAGAGMGSSIGTSIPFFLSDRAPKPVGLENEYCRIMVDQGWVGLGLWIGFLTWLLHRPPPLRLDAPWGLGVIIMFSLVVTNWATAFIGTGTLSSVPGSAILLTQMGIVARIREVSQR